MSNNKIFEVRRHVDNSLMSSYKTVDAAVDIIRQYISFDNIFLGIDINSNDKYYIYNTKTKEQVAIK